MKSHRSAGHISDRVVEACTSPDSVSSLLAQDPSLTPGEAWKRLYGDWKRRKSLKRKATDDDDASEEDATPDDLAKAFGCGKWGPSRPSDLFLKIYHDALCALEDDPINGVVSPSLMGSCGTMPVTIISTIIDIVRHMAGLIVKAEKEVFLATNYWQDSVASNIVTDAIRELDRRAGSRRSKVVVKIIYDRGSPKQLFEPHYYVPVKEYTGKNVRIPAPDEIPNTELQVVNFHTPTMGTFHAKYMIVDRKAAILQSNNIQDNDNLEMAIHLEGPIVDSMYDMALISWHKQLQPPLPTHKSPATENGVAEHGAGSELSGTADETTLSPQQTNTSLTHMDEVTSLLNYPTNPSFTGSRAPECPSRSQMTPSVIHPPHAPFPIAMVNRKSYGTPGHSSLCTPQNAAWLSALRHAKAFVFIQSPTLNASPLIPAIKDACERGIDVICWICLGYNDAGELLPKQGGHNEMVAHKLYKSLSPQGREKLHFYWYVAKDQTKPITQAMRKRSCHIKLMIADGHIGIQGNGNQDTQSWFHSQEINVMVDSEDICKAWMDGLRKNQNTEIYGALDKEEGVWRDGEGREAEGVMGVNPGGVSWAWGFVGAVKRVKGTGGF
ncbi:hypothetical protein OQA88_7142 [Cercophora sp. LCS_1]